MKYFLLAFMLLVPVVTITAATPKTAARSSRGVRFSDVQLKTGVRYAEQGNPKGEPVILLHGYSDSWFSYSRILPLIDKKYHVYVPDQRGHGDSDRPSVLLCDSSALLFAPTGLRLIAQGCRALAATLGKEEDLNPQPQRGCVCFVDSGMGAVATALRLRFQPSPIPG